MRTLALAPALLALCASRPEPSPLGLAVGTRWQYSFSAHLEDDFSDGRREVHDWSCTFTDTVVAARTAGDLSIFEIRRAVTSAHPPPVETEDLSRARGGASSSSAATRSPTKDDGVTTSRTHGAIAARRCASSRVACPWPRWIARPSL